MRWVTCFNPLIIGEPTSGRSESAATAASFACFNPLIIGEPTSGTYTHRLELYWLTFQSPHHRGAHFRSAWPLSVPFRQTAFQSPHHRGAHFRRNDRNGRVGPARFQSPHHRGAHFRKDDQGRPLANMYCFNPLIIGEPTSGLFDDETRRLAERFNPLIIGEPTSGDATVQQSSPALWFQSPHHRGAHFRVTNALAIFVARLVSIPSS